MKRADKYLYIMAALAAPGLAMWAIESGAEQAGLELRTFAQEIKGIYFFPCIGGAYLQLCQDTEPPLKLLADFR